jgi:hypothetical protein
MIRRPKRAVAALMVATALTVPSAALAETKPTAPAPPPAKEAPSQGPVAIKVTREEAIALAVKTFDIPADLGEPNVNIYQGEQGATWNLHWETSSKKPNRMMINVEVDAVTGHIRGYNRWTDMTQQQPPLSFTRDEALSRAAQWLDKLAAAQKADLKLLDSPMNPEYFYGGMDAAYEFRWVRQLKGYPVQGDGVTIAIDARTGELVRYYFQWREDVEFSLPASTLDREKAQAVYREQLPMQVYYRRYQKPGTDQGEWKLIYRPITGFYPSVDQQGRLIGTDGEPIDMAKLKDVTKVPPSDKVYQAPARPLTREEALQLAKSVAGRTDEPTSSNYSEFGEEQKVRTWSFQWYKKGELKEGEFNTDVGVDVDLGLVVSLSNWGPYKPLKEGEEPKITPAEAQARAIEFIRQHRPDLAGNLMVSSMADYHIRYKMELARMPYHHVTFQFMKNGIPVDYQQVSVEVDSMTGAIRSFYGRMETSKKEPFPAPEGLVSPADAMASFLKHQGLELSWMTFWKPPKEDGTQEKPAMQLVWAPSALLPLDSIDAKTGAPLDYSGRDLTEAMKRPTDIQGHFAQREIELLWARGIFELRDGKFEPAKALTIEEATRWLVLARGLMPFPNYDFYALGGRGEMLATKLKADAVPYFGAAFQAGIIEPDDLPEEFDPNAPVSRELFALWAVRAMGYGKVAKMETAIEMDFADKASIGAKYANAVALLRGFGIIKGAGAAFEPQRAITRGEAAKILFAVASEMRR